MHRSMWTYAWDLLDLGFDKALGELRDRADLNCVSLASSYHAGRFLQARSPKRKAYFPEDGTIYFHPTPARWEGLAIQPKVADVILNGGDVLRELVRRREAGGLNVSCWTVCLHNTRLGMLHPGAVTRNAFGDPNYYNLCPSNPDARAYVCDARRGPDPFLPAGYRRAREPVVHGFRARIPPREGWRRPGGRGRLRCSRFASATPAGRARRRPASTPSRRARSSRSGSSRRASGRRPIRAFRSFRLAASTLSGSFRRCMSFSSGDPSR